MGAACSTKLDDDPSSHDSENISPRHKSYIARTAHHFTMMSKGKKEPTTSGRHNSRDPWAAVLQSSPPSELEQEANRRLQNARKNDIVNIFEPAAPLTGFQGQRHPRQPGDHYLTNVDLINGGEGTNPPQTASVSLRRSQVLQIVEKMPKGAHLHIHFNANLDPHFLLEHAENEKELMTISSDQPLSSQRGLDTCEIQFLVCVPTQGHVYSVFDQKRYPFSADEQRILADGTQKAEHDRIRSLRRMSYARFRHEWEAIQGCFDQSSGKFVKSQKLKDIEKESGYSLSEDDWSLLTPLKRYKSRDWLARKLVFTAEETHHHNQDQAGAWAKFNGRTRMMKGLFNYESVYRAYTEKCLQQFVDENIQYAEIRPNFMQTNQIFRVAEDRKSLTTLSNVDTMKIIVEECEKFKKQLNEKRQNKETNKYFGGLKVIYCTPRSFSRLQIQQALNECFEFKNEWPEYIAGFDLVGEESRGQPLSYFKAELDAFQDRCEKKKVQIPFLLHCGETDDDADNNLETALSLKNTERIGHGFALLSKPHLRDEFVQKRICIESCPISNEILGLSSHPSKHAIYGLLLSGYHCALSSDNPTLFRSTLSHDFYQFLVGRGRGDQAMTLHVCKQLIQWSIEHACLDDKERLEIQGEWETRWGEFIRWINATNAFAVGAEPREEKAKRVELERLAKVDSAIEAAQKAAGEPAEKPAQKPAKI